MRTTGLKEMFIVRYADDFRIFCRTKDEALRTKTAVTQWLSGRLKLSVSEEKTKIVNVKRRYSDFLGFKIKVHKKCKTDNGQDKYVVKSHISDKNLGNKRKKLIEQAKKVAKASNVRTGKQEVTLYNQMVMGMQNYYRIATNVNLDCAQLNRAVMTVLTNRLRTQKKTRLVKKGRELTKAENDRYGKSRMLRYVAGPDEPIYPIGYVQHRSPMAMKSGVCSFTPEGRKGLHDNLRIKTHIAQAMMRQPLHDRSSEYADNRISLYAAQWGKCAVTNREFEILEDIHCHHKKPRKAFENSEKAEADKYDNLVLVLAPVHCLIHAQNEDVISKYLGLLKLSKSQLSKLNDLRLKAGLDVINTTKPCAKISNGRLNKHKTDTSDGAPCAVKVACTVLTGGKA
jgi:hypothetical protein